MQGLAARNEPDPDLEPILSNAAHVALPEVRAPLADVALACFLGGGERDGRRRIDVDTRRSRLGDDGPTVEEAHNPFDLIDAERSLERWREAKRYLDLIGVDERRQTSTGIAAVGRRQRASIPAREDDLHRQETS
jgi:hypothetical protein